MGRGNGEVVDGVLHTISGRGWSQGFGAIFEDSDLGRDPEHDNKLKNGVGDVLTLWDI